MTAIACLAIGLLAVALCWWRYGWLVTPDGQQYLAMARGEPVPDPFRWRLLPRLLGRYPRVWHAVSWLSLVGCCVLVGQYAEQLGIAGWAAAALFVTLPWFRGLVRMPLLTDQVGMLAALGCALLPWWAAIPCALVAGAANEKAPLFAAVFAWSPIPLVGAVVPAVVAMVTKRGPKASHNDWRAMRELHNRAQPHVYLLPWGACLLAVLAPSWQLLLAVAGGYGMFVMATDRARLYQYGCPVAVVATLSVLPPQWWPLAVLVNVVSPACDWCVPWK